MPKFNYCLSEGNRLELAIKIQKHALINELLARSLQKTRAEINKQVFVKMVSQLMFCLRKKVLLYIKSSRKMLQ